MSYDLEYHRKKYKEIRRQRFVPKWRRQTIEWYPYNYQPAPDDVRHFLKVMEETEGTATIDGIKGAMLCSLPLLVVAIASIWLPTKVYMGLLAPAIVWTLFWLYALRP